MVRTAAGKACASVKTVRASVKTPVFAHRSFAIVRVSGKEQQELAMCWRCDRVSKTHGSAIVIDTRTEGSKGLGHRSVRSENQTGFSSHSSRLPLRLEGGPQKPCAHNVTQKRQEDASQEENAAVSMDLRFLVGNWEMDGPQG